MSRRELFKIVKDLEKTQLDELRFLCQHYEIPKSDLESCGGTRLLELLEQYGLINYEKKEFDPLLEMLEDIGRSDLKDKLKSLCTAEPSSDSSGSQVTAVKSLKNESALAQQLGELSISENEAQCSTETSVKSPALGGNPSQQYGQVDSATSVKSLVTGRSPSRLYSQADSPTTPPSNQAATVPHTLSQASPAGVMLPPELKNLEKKRVHMDLDVDSPEHPTMKQMEASEGAVKKPFSGTSRVSLGYGTRTSSVEQTRQPLYSRSMLDRELGMDANFLGQTDSPKQPQASKGEDVSDDGKPVPVQLYDYQQELAQAAVKGANSIVCAPTGSGKTLTAAHVCRILYDKCHQQKENFRGLFIVPIRTLVTQQCAEFRKVFPDNPTIIRPISDATERLKDVIDKQDAIVFLTAQILLNALKEDEVFLTDFDAIILDECHHTTLNHPFNEIMRHYLKLKNAGVTPLPQILGMTASLGTGGGKPIDHYIRLCANLDCTQISHVRKNLDELLSHNPKPKTDQILSVVPRAANPFAVELFEIMEKIEKSEFLSQLGGFPLRGSNSYEQRIVELRDHADKNGLTDVASACFFLRKLNDALMYYEDFHATHALEYIEVELVEGIEGTPTDCEERFLNFYMKKKPRLEDLAAVDESPMLDTLVTKLEELLASDHPGIVPKGLLLTKRRAGVNYLHSYLREHLTIGSSKVGYLTGQAQGSGMTDSRQNKVIEQFKSKNGYRLLVATNVAEEGLDIPRCNFVFRYNFVSNEIGRMQSKGRARAKESECYLIVKRGSVDERVEYKNLTKEHQMQEALLEVDKMDAEELKRLIHKKQEELLATLNLKKQAAAHGKTMPNQGIQILCKKGHHFLCMAEDIRKKGSHYICADKDFPDRVEQQWFSPVKQKHFRTDSHVGTALCKECMTPIGNILRYKESKRACGFTFGKDNIVYQLEGSPTYGIIKKWTTVPFFNSISEEKMSD